MNVPAPARRDTFCASLAMDLKSVNGSAVSTTLFRPDFWNALGIIGYHAIGAEFDGALDQPRVVHGIEEYLKAGIMKRSDELRGGAIKREAGAGCARVACECCSRNGDALHQRHRSRKRVYLADLKNLRVQK